MDDGFQDVIRGPAVDRKPNRAALDAALGAEMQAPRPLHQYEAAVYTGAVVGATLGANLIKESFDKSIAHRIGGVEPDVNSEDLRACDPALYHQAIELATLDGFVVKEFFDKFVAQIDYHSMRLAHPPLAIRQSTEPRALHQRPDSMPLVPQALESRGNAPSPEPSAARAAYTSRPHSAQVNDEHSTHPQTIQEQSSAHGVATQTNPGLYAQSRLRHGSPLPEQKDVWAAIHKRGRDRRRRSRSPSAGRQGRDRASRDRRQNICVRNHEVEYAATHETHTDHGHPSQFDTSGDEICNPTPEESTAVAPSRRLLPSTSENQHNPLPTELCSMGNPNHTINGGTPEPAVQPTHPLAPQCLPNDHGSHSHTSPESNHNKVQGNRDNNNACSSTSLLARPLAPSVYEPLQRKNQHAVCIECWSRGLRCDSKVVCDQCAKRVRPCSYVQCPLRNCPRDIMCPAYHSWRGDDSERFVGSSMHLMTLLNLNPPSPPGYDLSEIRAMFRRPDSAEEIYRQIAAELEEEDRSGQRIDTAFVKQLVLDREAAVASHDKVLMPKVKLIVQFIAEKKKPRYQEPYKREQRILRFGPASQS